MTSPTQSLWVPHATATTQPLTTDLDVDVAIIGAGITGLTAALRLTDAGKHVVVLEGRTVASGCTGGTSAHLTEAVDSRYVDIAKHFGKKGARLVAESSRAALEHIADLAGTLDIACDLQRVPGYLYTEDRGERDELAAERDAAAEAGLAVTLDVEPGLPFPVAGSLRFSDQMRFQPYSYVRGLERALLSRGALLHENTRVVKLVEGDPIVLTTDGGRTVRARAVFCATHMPLNYFLVHLKLTHEQSYVTAYESSHALEDALFWDTASPYHYTRTATVDGKRWLVIGGEDHSTGEEKHADGSFDRLGAYARDRFSVGEPEYRWSAQLVSSSDGLPYIGRNAASKHVYVATGFGGNGLTFGTVSALLVSDLILGVDNPWTTLYHATRVKLASVGGVVKEGLSTTGHLLRHAEVNHTSEIAAGQGALVHQGGKHLAVYRDPEGTLHGVSSRCTHLGCVLAFNDAERTWDCPCHGSRFSPDGAILEGPALEALERHPVTEG